jgi:hypothetical protein
MPMKKSFTAAALGLAKYQHCLEGILNHVQKDEEMTLFLCIHH